MMDLSQSQIQSQIQTLSQKQIQSLEILSYGAGDLREAVYRAVEDNPALVITKDPFSGGVDTGALKGASSRKFSDGTRTVSAKRISMDAERASDHFSAALDAHADERESLQEHLLSQFRVIPLSPSELKLGEKLIYNLDSRGFHILSPVSLLDLNDKNQTSFCLEKVMNIIRELDPVGTCTSSTEESLLVQAKIKGGASGFTLFLLDGHLDFLDPPKADKVLLKFKNYKKEHEKMFAISSVVASYLELEPDEEDVLDSLSYIRKLDPFPARNYGTEVTKYVSADVVVEPVTDAPDSDEKENGIVVTENKAYLVRSARSMLPEISLNPDFLSLEKSEAKNSLSQEEQKVVSQGLKRARDFIDSLKFRQDTVFRAVCEIVRKQSEFFEKGPGHLVPLRQQDIAQILGVHESTISRMANSKYVQCQWGLFEVKYFFSATSLGDSSRDKVLRMIKEILSSQEPGDKKISDQKLTDMLNEKGVQVARRTVAKYRKELLNIDSSFNR